MKTNKQKRETKKYQKWRKNDRNGDRDTEMELNRQKWRQKDRNGDKKTEQEINKQKWI